jgi:DNA polymerase III alpha subunit
LSGNHSTPIRFGGDIVSVKIKTTQSGKNAGKERAEIELRDLTGKINITIWSDVYEQYSHLISVGNSIIIEVERGFGSFSNILCGKVIMQAI